MKNHEEFRSAVFEKAKKFEAKRKARNKKIAETVSLCSLALVIALSAYLGILPSLETPDDLTATTSDTTVGSTLEEITSSHTSHTSHDSQTTEHHDASVTTTSTTATLTTATSLVDTTTEYTYTTETEIENTTNDHLESSVISLPIISKLEFRASAKDPDFAVGKTLLSEIESYADWQAFLEEHKDDYPTLEDSSILLDAFDEAYFEENTLVVIQYVGYEIIAFGSDIPMDPADKDEKYTLYINLKENASDSRKQIHILSVDKASYEGAEIRIWESSEN